MRLIHWLAVVSAPLSICILVYLFLLPHQTSKWNDNPEIVFITIEPLPGNFIPSQLDTHAYPFIEKLFHEGFYSPMSTEYALTFLQAKWEALTGKICVKLPFTQPGFDTHSYTIIPPESTPPPGAGSLQNILIWNYKTFAEIECDEARRSNFPGDPKNLLLVYPVRGCSSPEDYLQRIDDVLKVISEKIHPDVTILMMPLATTREYDIFKMNEWLRSMGLLHANGAAIDWEKTKVFCASSLERGIRIHRKDLYAKGIVSRGELARLKKLIVRKLKSVRVLKENSPLFFRVQSGEKTFKYSLPGEFPDIYLRVAKNSRPLVFDTAISPGQPPDTFFAPASEISDKICMTSRGSFILFYGSECLPVKNGFPMQLVDVAPTILYLLGLPIARDMQGHVMFEALVPARREFPIRYVDSFERCDPRVRQPGTFFKTGKER